MYIGTLVLSGLLWGLLLPKVAPDLVSTLEPFRTKIAPVIGGVVGALAAAALFGALGSGRQRGLGRVPRAPLPPAR
jgi:uncharacterized membrane protein YeaQ/YmgE (transglycosylase-associated protein family)